MYVGTRHKAWSTRGTDAEFTCKVCRTTRWVRVKATGYGADQSSYFIGQGAARDRAATAATNDAYDIAHAALEFVACPKCGAHSERKTPLALLGIVATPAIVGGLAGALVVALVFELDRAWIGAALGLLIGAVPLLARRRRAADAAGSVEFFDGEPRDRPFVGQRCAVCDLSIVTVREGHRCETCGRPLHNATCAQKHADSTHASKPR